MLLNLSHFLPSAVARGGLSHDAGRLHGQPEAKRGGHESSRQVGATFQNLGHSMKVCVLNFSGNGGKNIIAAHLLQPRLNAPVFSVERLNDDTTDYRQRLRDAANEDEQDAAIQMIAMKRLATTCDKNLDAAFDALFGAASPALILALYSQTS
jgi:endonuclease V-like protein UPF0215 family